MVENDKKKLANMDVCLKKVRELAQDVRYGNIILVIQDGIIIQIDKTEKIRL